MSTRSLNGPKLAPITDGGVYGGTRSAANRAAEVARLHAPGQCWLRTQDFANAPRNYLLDDLFH